MEPVAEILCSHRRRRDAEIFWLVMHVNVGPEVERGARGLAGYLARPSTVGGYHEVGDNSEVIRTARDNEEVNGAGSTANNHGWHYCLIGQADQSAEQWADAYSSSQLVNAAKRIADRCRELAIPAVLLSGGDLRARRKGICGHVTVRDAFPRDTNHWDPGPHFPWGLFVELVKRELGEPSIVPAPPIVPVTTGGIDVMLNAKAATIPLKHLGFGLMKGYFDAGQPVHECQASLHGPEPDADGWWEQSLDGTVRAQVRGNRVVVTAFCPRFKAGMAEPSAHVLAVV